VINIGVFLTGISGVICVLASILSVFLPYETDNREPLPVKFGFSCMPAKILSGKPIAETIKDEIRAEVADLREVHGFSPCLAFIRVGDDPASSVYVGNKARTSEELGLISIHHHLAAETETDELLELVRNLNENDDVDGILVQLPLPSQIDESLVLEAIDPAKDVDGFHPINVGGSRRVKKRWCHAHLPVLSKY
jgi:5,10-methylene-tetrahydrofolate dehydrogenase/methenyl tetrahydrofolate cyclohydrolase